jgi:hypothetical protein
MESMSEAIKNLRLSKEMEDTEQFKRLAEANREYNELVEKGIIIPRGYNLMTIEDKGRQFRDFNDF